MRRRTFSALCGVLVVAPAALLAQPAKRVYRIAILDDAGEKARPQDWSAFRERLRQLGLIERKNAIYDARYASGQHERLASLAAELVSAKPDIVVTAGTPAALSVKKATTSIPVVFIDAGDPVGAGLVAGLARPGGNITGISSVGRETTQKVLELLRDVLPETRRIGYLGDSANKATSLAYARLAENARSMNLSTQMFDVVGRTDLERSFAAIRRERIQALIVSNAGTVLEHRDQIIAFAVREKLPLVSGRREYADAGGLFAYGSDRRSTFVRAAELAHRILQGAKPAELPVEQISVIRMVLNLKTASALGIKIPVAVLTRADEVIE